MFTFTSTERMIQVISHPATVSVPIARALSMGLTVIRATEAAQAIHRETTRHLQVVSKTIHLI